jgi:biotin operon repressor
LSYRARGVLADVLDREQGTPVSGEWLTERTTEGRDAMRMALKELRSKGYARLVQVQVEHGRWESRYEFSDVPGYFLSPATGFQAPVDENPQVAPTTAHQSSVDQSSVDQSSVNQPLTTETPTAETFSAETSTAETSTEEVVHDAAAKTSSSSVEPAALTPPPPARIASTPSEVKTDDDDEHSSSSADAIRSGLVGDCVGYEISDPILTRLVRSGLDPGEVCAFLVAQGVTDSGALLRWIQRLAERDGDMPALVAQWRRRAEAVGLDDAEQVSEQEEGQA